jgi:hypothetical protein
LEAEKWRDSSSLALTRRLVTTPAGRVLDITADRYAWFDQLWLPARIVMRSGPALVTIVLSGIE